MDCHDAVRKYQENPPEFNDVTLARYMLCHPEVHRAAIWISKQSSRSS